MAVAKQDGGKKTTTTKESNKQAIQNINRTGTVSGKSSGVKGSSNVVRTNTDTSNLAGNNRQQALGTPKMTQPSKTNVLGKTSKRETGKTFVPETKTPTVSTVNTDLKKYQSTLSGMADESTRKANNVLNGISNAYNSFMENLNTPTKRIQQREEYKQQRTQAKLDAVNKENMDLANQTTDEDYRRMYDANGQRIDNSQQKKDLQDQIAQLDTYISEIGDEAVTAAELARRNELQAQLDEFDLLDRKAQALEELYAQKTLKGDDLSSYQEMISHKNDNIFERFGNVMNHLGNTTANIIPTAFDQMKETRSNAYAKENIAELDRLHEIGEIDDELYKESLSEWQDYIDRHKSTNSDNLSQIIRANADAINANTYYGANEVERFVLQAGESTAQFLLHYALLGEAATISMSLTSGTEKMNQLLLEGVDPDTAAMNGFMTGLVSYVTEKIGMDRFVNMMGTPFSADALGSILLSHFKSGVSEGLEEVAEGLVDPLIDAYTLGKPYEVNGNELWMEFLLGGASGLAMAFGGTAIGTVNTAVQINSLLNERRGVRADVQNQIGQLIVNSQYQKNLLVNEINKFKEHFNSMTDTQKQVATELISKGQNAIEEYDMKSQVQGVTFSADIPYETTSEENNHAIFETYTPDFNSEVQFEQKIAETESIINDLMDAQLSIENVENQTQQILNENGYDIDAKVFNSLSSEQQQKALVALDFANIMGMNVNVVNNLPKGQSGFVDSKGNITIDASKNPVLYTLSHELTHGTESSKFYDSLKNLVMSNIEGDWNELVNKKIEDYAKGNIPLDFENAEKEVVARYVEDKLGDEKFIEDLIKYNYSVASRIYQDLKSMGSDDEVVKIRNAFEKAFKDYRQFSEASDSKSAASYDADVVNSMSPDDDAKIANENPDDVTGKDALKFSYIENNKIAQAQDELYDKRKTELLNLYKENGQNVTEADMNEMLAQAHEDMDIFADLMRENSSILPNEVIGKVLLKDASYGYSVENSTKCPRTLAYDELTNYVADKVGRPLTAIESFLVSQKLYSIAVEPQCLYCYVALDRKSYNEFVGRYIDQRDSAIKAYVEAGSPKLPKSFNEAVDNDLFIDFLDGRKPTKNMWNRYSSWIDAYNKGEKLLTKRDVRNDWSRNDIKNSKGPEWEQLKDMLAYAQSASWAKKAIDYRAYLDDIRKLSQRQVNELNKHYGLRWYSFNDYTPAYILENMQQFVDASLKGLKGLAYTKDTDFARIFAPTGVNINISAYVTRDANGNFIIDPVQSANIEEAIQLREQYPNVGIVVTGTDSEAIRWALAQPWTDVVIPFHIVRTGADIAEYYKWTVFNAQQNDTVINDEVWKQYVESLTGVSRENEEAFKKAEKKTSKMIYPSEHQNDRETFLKLCEERGLKPRFSEFLDDPNYMKLVNETRQSDAQTGYLVPKFDMDAAYDSFEWFKNKGGFYGGWWKDNIQLSKEANEVANDVLAIEQGSKKYEDIQYGEGYVDFDKYKTMLKNRKNLSKKHGTGNAIKYSYDSELSKKAKEEFGTTDDYRKAGYILGDGSYLDLSEGQDRRMQDHRTVGMVFDGIDYAKEGMSAGLIKFMNGGNIRISPESGSVDISRLNEPTNAQYRQLADFLRNYRDEWRALDVSNEDGSKLFSAEYPPFSPISREINDIRNFFEDGTVPSQDELDELQYAYNPETPLGETEMSDEQMNIKSRVPNAKDLSEQKTARVLEKAPEYNKSKDAWKRAKTVLKGKTISRYAAVEELADQTKNKKLVPLLDEVMRAQGRANVGIYEGLYDKAGKKKIGKSLVEIMGKIPQQYRHAFDEYMYHWRNVDEMSMADRFAKKDLEAINKQLKELKKNETLDKKTKNKQIRELEKRKKELNKIKNRPVFGKDVTAEDSMDWISEIEQMHPEFREIAEEMWELNRQYLKMRQDSGIISEDTYNDFIEKRPHYIPIIRDVGGSGVSAVNPNDIRKFKGSTRDILPLEDAMKRHILKSFQATSQNDLNNEIIQAYGGGEKIDSDELIDLIDEGFNPAVENPDGKQIAAYKNGEKIMIPVSDEMYDALAPQKMKDSALKEVADQSVAKLSKWRKSLLTNWNPIFSIFTNPMRDIQDAFGQTKYGGARYLRNLIKAAHEVATDGELSKQYDNLGISQSQYVGKDVLEAYEKMQSDKGMKKFLNNLTGIGEAIEKIPRLAEFISSVEAGNDTQQAAYDAAEITTNFKRGGTTVKNLDKYGFPFLNASVQGFDKQVRNAKGDIQKIKDNGIKGVISVLARLTLASGIPLRLLQDWLWKDDDDYKELSDYIKSRYYIVAKTNGRFVRIPKGRVAAFYQTVLTGGYKLAKQQTDVWNMLLDDWQSFADNVAPNSVADSFIGSPLIQAHNNKSWYGSDIVPSRLQDLPDSEQYDESTDYLSIALGDLSRKIAKATKNDKFELSPYKINYVLDQYSGVAGDFILPAITLKTDVGINNPVGKFFASPILDKFTTDPVLKNQNVSTAYDLLNTLKTKSKSKYAQPEEILAYKYLSSVATEMGKLYAQKRDIQGNKELTNKEKVEMTRKIQREINVYAKAALANYDNIDIEGKYAVAGGVQYYQNDNGVWTKTRKETLEKLNNADLSMEDRGYYFETNSQISDIRDKIKENTPEGERASYTKETIDAIQNSKLSAKGKNALYDSYYDGKTTKHINSMNLTDEQKLDLKIANSLAEGKKDKNGKTISNSKAEATAEAYDKLGLLDDVIKYIKDNDINPSEMGLSKTVYNKLLKGGTYQSSYNSSMNKKSSKTAKKSSGGVSSGGSSRVSGGGSGGRLNKLAPVTKTSLIDDKKIANGATNYMKAYASVFNRSGKKPNTGGRAASVTCPRCGSQVSSSNGKCPVCGANL